VAQAVQVLTELKVAIQYFQPLLQLAADLVAVQAMAEQAVQAAVVAVLVQAHLMAVQQTQQVKVTQVVVEIPITQFGEVVAVVEQQRSATQTA